MSFGIKNISDCADYVVASDADYTYPAEHIPEMVDLLTKNPQIGMVCGNCLNSFSAGNSNNIFSWVINS